MLNMTIPPKTTGNLLLRESVYEQLRADIIKCRILPGSDIREAALAERFQVSKSPIRDALMRLEREGLVITIPRQGYRVTPISLADVEDMFHLRAALERACMERIVRRASSEELATLDPFREFDPGHWEAGFVEYNRAFHRHLAQLAGNARMRDHLGDLIDQMERAVLVSINNIKHGNPATVVAEHCELIDALQERKSKRAEKIAEDHINAAAKRVTNAVSLMVIRR
ncbi:MAG TPA: GntR family transcriptional regulator [Herbaspirillum sp.]|jgi:DNA-binding GntR family transcriptional regulator